MKVVLGIDLQQAYIPALHQLAKLRMKDVELILVQTSPPIEATLPPYPVDGAVIDMVQQTFRAAAEEALARATDEAKALGMPAKSLFCLGPSGELINEVVEDEGAELVALRSMHHGAFQSEFMGSVTRVVMSGCKTSVLVAKQEPKVGPTVDVVFGADGSPFNGQCVDRFISFKPAGIGTIFVVAAWGCASQLEHVLRHALHHSLDVDAKLKSVAEHSAHCVADRLSGAGYRTQVLVGQGTSEHVLAEQMRETEAELLVVGAHAKGLIERTIVGSTSLHEVINEPYNVLLLRPSLLPCTIERITQTCQTQQRLAPLRRPRAAAHERYSRFLSSSPPRFPSR